MKHSHYAVLAQHWFPWHSFRRYRFTIPARAGDNNFILDFRSFWRQVPEQHLEICFDRSPST